MINIYALIGSLTLIAFLMKKEKDKHDNNTRYKKTWKSFFSSNWDDFALALLSGQLLAKLQEPLFFGLVRYMDWDYDKYVDIYFDAEEAMSFIVGFGATYLIGWLYKWIMKKVNTDG